MKKFIYTILFFSSQAIAQDFNITKVEVAGDLINVYYDLLDSTARRTYTVKLLSSRDNFISPLDKVTGDIGLEVKPGGNRKISWNAKDELGATFEGQVSLEIRGRIYIPFVRLSGDYASMKRMKPYEITWSGGTEQNILNFDLYRGGEKVTTFPNIANVGHYTMTLPSSVKPGSGYSFKISDTKNQDQIVNTKEFKVKRKVPLIIKVLPIIAIGAVASTIKGSSSSGEAATIPTAPGHP